jgi:hypothetical protein
MSYGFQPGELLSSDRIPQPADWKSAILQIGNLCYRKGEKHSLFSSHRAWPDIGKTSGEVNSQVATVPPKALLRVRVEGTGRRRPTDGRILQEETKRKKTKTGTRDKTQRRRDSPRNAENKEAVGVEC